MNFLSDTTSAAHPSMISALENANTGYEASYGADQISERVKTRLQTIFQTDLEVLFTTSGTAANALALSVLAKGDDAILCHDEAHIHRDERGAPEFFTGGSKLLPLKGAHGKISAQTLGETLTEWPRDFVHTTPPNVLSLSQLNEAGCAYRLDEIKALTSKATEFGLSTHMDGARLANALIALDCSPADMTWKAGIDVLCLGATKNGALAAEAVILFPPAMDRFAKLQARQKRAGHMIAKMRFVAAQIEAWLTEDLWLNLAQKANQLGQYLSESLVTAGAELVHPTDGNEVFVNLPSDMTHKLQKAGAKFYGWPDGSARFVTSWSSCESEIEAVLKAVQT